MLQRNAALQKRIVECSFKIDTDFISRDSACLLVKLNLIFQISSIININFWQSFHRSGKILLSETLCKFETIFPYRTCCMRSNYFLNIIISVSLFSTGRGEMTIKNRPILLGDMVCVCANVYVFIGFVRKVCEIDDNDCFYYFQQYLRTLDWGSMKFKSMEIRICGV